MKKNNDRIINTDVLVKSKPNQTQQNHFIISKNYCLMKSNLNLI